MGSERGDTLSTTNNTRNMNKQELIQGMCADKGQQFPAATFKNYKTRKYNR